LISEIHKNRNLWWDGEYRGLTIGRLIIEKCWESREIGEQHCVIVERMIDKLQAKGESGWDRTCF
jgi:hypothetical protein